MQQGRLLRVERRVEPEPALGREVRLHLHVRDEEAVPKDLPLRFQTEHPAHWAARAIGRDDVLGAGHVAPVWRLDFDQHVIALRLNVHHAIAPARVHAAGLEQALDQKLLQKILLQVDERGVLVSFLRKQVEGVQQLVAQVHFAEVPDHALRHRALRAAEAIQDLKRALREADGAAAFRQGRFLVHQHAIDPVQREVDRRAQADRPCAHHDHGVVAGLPRSQLGGFAVCEQIRPHQESRVLAQPSSAAHSSLSRCAVQMRGSGYCVASSYARLTSKGMQ